MMLIIPALLSPQPTNASLLYTKLLKFLMYFHASADWLGSRGVTARLLKLLCASPLYTLRKTSAVDSNDLDLLWTTRLQPSLTHDTRKSSTHVVASDTLTERLRNM